jgi:hypothetical protein
MAASAEARQRLLYAMVEAASPYLRLYAPIAVDIGGDPQQDQQRRNEWETFSDSRLEHERLRLSAWVGYEVGTSLLDREQSHQAVSHKGGEARARRRRRWLAELDAEIRLLRPHMRAKPAYDVLRLAGKMSWRTFQGRWAQGKNTLIRA